MNQPCTSTDTLGSLVAELASLQLGLASLQTQCTQLTHRFQQYISRDSPGQTVNVNVNCTQSTSTTSSTAPSQTPYTQADDNKVPNRARCAAKIYCVFSPGPLGEAGCYLDLGDYANAVREPDKPWTRGEKIQFHKTSHSVSVNSVDEALKQWSKHGKGPIRWFE